MDAARLVQVLSDLPTALLEGYDLEDVMSRLGDDIAEAMRLAGAGVMLEDQHGRLRFVVASDPVLRELERLQVEYDEGPCLLAYRTGEVVHTPDLRDEPRFALFATAASTAGLGAVFSYPLHYGDEVIGALNLYDTSPRHLSDDDDEIGRTLARVATAYLLNARDAMHYRTENAHLAQALERRVLVEQAKGYIRAAADCDVAQAWEAIRRHARARQLRAEEVARQVLAGDLPVDDLLAPGGRR